MAQNEQSPELRVPAIVKSNEKMFPEGQIASSLTRQPSPSFFKRTYKIFCTFEFDSGDRSEFHVSGKEYGLISEDDILTLNIQGTRYLGFERKKVKYKNT